MESDDLGLLIRVENSSLTRMALHEKEYIKDYRCDNVDCSYCIYNVCIEPSRKEFPLEQYNYLVTVWCIFSCDSSAAYCSEDEKVKAKHSV